MAFQVSPGVLVKEIDLTNVVPATATSIGAIVGAFEKGPMNEILTIESEKQLVEVFGKPNNSNFETWFTAANFLQYGNNLKVVRAETGARTAIANGGTTLFTGPGTDSAGPYTMSQSVTDTGLIQVTVDNVETTDFTVVGNDITFGFSVAASSTILIKLGIRITNSDYYDSNYADGSGSVGSWASKYPGDWGNSIGVSICSSADAYEKENVTTVASEATAAGILDASSVVAVTDGTVFQEGDIVNFGEASGQQYEVVSIAVNNLTVRQLDNPNGGGLKTTIAAATAVRRRWRFYDLFNAAPGTSSWAKGVGLTAANDEMHIVVYDTQGKITGYSIDVPGNRGNSIIESFAFLSKHSGAKTAQGGNNFYSDVMNRTSEYVWWMDHPTSGTDWGSNLTAAGSNTQFDGPVLPVVDTLSIGSDDFAPSIADIKDGYDLLSDAETVDVNLVMGGQTPAGDENSLVHAINMIDFAEGRKDCVAFISPPRADVVGVPSSIDQTNNVLEYYNQLPSSSYAVFDSGYKYMYDKYNDVFRFVPLNGDIAGLCANTDNVADTWYSPGGFNRGQIRGAVKLAYNPSKTQRDQLYPARINPVVAFPGEGTVLFGDKTALSKPSAFDRINVRRLFLVLEKSIARAAKFQLFEFNDEFTRAQFKSLVEPFLREVQGRRGITDFAVVCDGTNNSAEVIDRNEFVADIFIKPARSINFITLSFIAVRTGVSFSEVGG